MDAVFVKSEGFNNILTPRQGDAGYDLIAESEPLFKDGFVEYDTNVSLESLDADVHAFVLPRSSISKTNLILCNGPSLIDNGYRGTIRLRFRYLPQEKDFSVFAGQVKIKENVNRIYKKGDKIAQLLFFKELPRKLIAATELNNTERGEGGFGSTGK